MIYAVGTKNPAKLAAVADVYPGSIVHGHAVASCVSAQPLSLDEIIKGARHRAIRAMEMSEGGSQVIGLGIESGLMEVSTVGWMDVCACVIIKSTRDGVRHAVGFSGAFTVPSRMAALVLSEGLDLNQASKKTGFTDKALLGNEEGLIGIMSGGAVTRKSYTIQAIQMAEASFAGARIQELGFAR